MQDSQIKEGMFRNFEKRLGQYQPESSEQVWAKMDPEKLYKLLKSCSKVCGHDAKYLLERMATKSWTIKATAHEGGIDAKAPLHITVQVKGERSYHLNVKENSGLGLHIYEITKGT